MLSDLILFLPSEKVVHNKVDDCAQRSGRSSAIFRTNVHFIMDDKTI